ncbi:synaptic vesicle glycoprotein 2C isoform X1 [Fopius arisanus]|uniref:Sv2b_11 protein n=1 Tax=Fopius arisanus TaxID=64838 RepID=A0A0C9PZZ9_9HYME|nr:PREDICTED: synaptic vesicle glycoprotein 2C-like isoform X1 [Fopius arisanus]
MVSDCSRDVSIFTVEEKSKSRDQKTDYETAIKLCGYGRFHYGFVLVCGMMFLSVAFQNGVNAYILPSAECDLKLSSEQKGFLNVAFLIGGVLSSVFWGVSADAYGRKKILVWTLIIDSIVTLISSFSQTFHVLVAFRAINGFTIGAPGSLIYTYLGEFHSSKHRVKSICYVGFFWTLAWLLLPGLAWLIIPLKLNLHILGFAYNSWQLFLALMGLPTLLMGLILINYPESPKFLLARGINREALEIMRQMFSINTGKDKSDYPVTELWASSEEIQTKNVRFDDELSADSSSTLLVIMRLLKNAWMQIQALSTPPLSTYAILCWTIYFTNMCGYYGLGLWLPELFNRFENFYRSHPDTPSVSVCQLVARNDTIKPELQNCEEIVIDENVFINTLIVNAVCLLGNIISGFFADRVGRRTLPVTLTIIAGVSGLTIYFTKTSTQILIVACIYSLTVSAANIVIGSVTVDIFPTYVGALAICMMTCFGRVGAIASNLAFGMLLDISCEVPIILVAGIVLSGAALTLMLPPATKT